jgi:hypothetical protein
MVILHAQSTFILLFSFLFFFLVFAEIQNAQDFILVHFEDNFWAESCM